MQKLGVSRHEGIEHYLLREQRPRLLQNRAGGVLAKTCHRTDDRRERAARTLALEMGQYLHKLADHAYRQRLGLDWHENVGGVRHDPVARACQPRRSIDDCDLVARLE